MDCGSGSDFGGGECSSSGVDFSGSDFGGIGASHDTNYTSTTHSTVNSVPTSSTTQWTSTSVSRPAGQSAASKNSAICFIVLVFIFWFGIAGVMAYMAATNISPFLAFPPICIALFVFCAVGCLFYENMKRQREFANGPHISLNTAARAQSNVHSPPSQQRIAPGVGYSASYPPSGQPQFNPAYSTDYGQQQYGISGQQIPRPSALPSQVPGEDKPPSYNEVVKGGSAPLGVV